MSVNLYDCASQTVWASSRVGRPVPWGLCLSIGWGNSRKDSGRRDFGHRISAVFGPLTHDVILL